MVVCVWRSLVSIRGGGGFYDSMKTICLKSQLQIIIVRLCVDNDGYCQGCAASAWQTSVPNRTNSCIWIQCPGADKHTVCMHIHAYTLCQPAQQDTIPKGWHSSVLKVIIAVQSQWLCVPDSSVTVCQLGNKPVSSTFTMMKAGTLKALCRLSLHTLHKAAVFNWLHTASHCSDSL